MKKMEMNEMETKVVETPVEAAPGVVEVEAPAATSAVKAETPKTNFKNVLNICGILSLIFGLIVFNKNTGYSQQSITYGGDAYTGIQNAAAQAANNVKFLNEAVVYGFGALLIVVGIALVCYFGRKYVIENNK